VVLLCALFNQLLKLLLYSLAGQRLNLAVVAQNHGLPSSSAAVLACLLVSVWLRSGWSDAETGFVLVFSVIVIHDTVKLRRAASRQREVVFALATGLGADSRFRTLMADYLDPRSHHPVHVAVGVVLGGLFALAMIGVPS